MKKINNSIEVVSSSLASLSSMSAASRKDIAGVLSKYYSSVRVTIVDNLDDLDALVSRQPDLVFLGMKFIPVHEELGREDPDKIWLSDYLDKNDIAYTGSSRFAQELERDKPLAKERVHKAGLATADYFVAKKNSQLNNTFKFPLFVKPTDRGGGGGIAHDSVVETFQDLCSKVQQIHNALNSDALIETYLPGREFSIAILRDKQDNSYETLPLELLPPIDIYGRRVLSSKVKMANITQFIAVEDGPLRTIINSLALDVFHVLRARDYGRIDIRLDAFGKPQFLEANLIPSLLNNYGNFPRACFINKGLDYEDILLNIVSLAFQRSNITSDLSMVQISTDPVTAL